MNMTSEEIKQLIKSKESQQEAELYKLKTEYREAVKRKFTEDTGISEGDKFECTTTYKDNIGLKHIDKICGTFVGFGFDWLSKLSLIYSYADEDSTPSRVVRSMIIHDECSYQFRKL